MEAPPEVLLFDTSHLGAVERIRRRPNRAPKWPAEVVTRIDAAAHAISVVTIAEARSGHLYAGWGRAREEAEKLLRAYLWIPLDPQIVDSWAILDSSCRKGGRPHVDDNDNWIAATAIEQDLVLITCDRGQSEPPDLRDPIYSPDVVRRRAAAQLGDSRGRLGRCSPRQRRS
jgi:predicted nucleic acid-binding protein